jgi:hypothetical protein
VSFLSPLLSFLSPFLSSLLSFPVNLILFGIDENSPCIVLYSALLFRFSICPLFSSYFFSPMHISQISFFHIFYSSFHFTLALTTFLFYLPFFRILPFTSLLSLLLNHLQSSNPLTLLYLLLHLLPPYLLSLASVTSPPPITPQTWRMPTSKACLSMVDTDRTGGGRMYWKPSRKSRQMIHSLPSCPIPLILNSF